MGAAAAQPAHHGRAQGPGAAAAAVLSDAYGADADTRGGIADAVLANHDWCYDIVRGGAEGGHEAFAEHWNGGAAQRAERTRAWYVESRDVLLRAVS